MPTSLTVEQHLTALHTAMLAFAREAARAGLDVAVPTCPGWTVRRLVGHQGAVHRRTVASLRGAGGADGFERAAVEKAGRSSADPVEWLRDGSIALVKALVAAPADLDVGPPLDDAPGARHAWARRQCHETTVHAVDATSAALGRAPGVEDVSWITREVALDGIDELLLGIVPRLTTALDPVEPCTVVVRPDGAAVSYVVRLSTAPAVTTLAAARGEGGQEGDVVVEGDPVRLYLGLWHRLDGVAPDGWPRWDDTAV